MTHHSRYVKKVPGCDRRAASIIPSCAARSAANSLDSIADRVARLSQRGGESRSTWSPRDLTTLRHRPARFFDIDQWPTITLKRTFCASAPAIASRRQPTHRLAALGALALPTYPTAVTDELLTTVMAERHAGRQVPGRYPAAAGSARSSFNFRCF
jgi:hypothetical protein